MDNLKNYLTERLQQQLPGNEAHMKMASYKRASAQEALASDKNAKLSAVLILLFPEKDQIHTVFIQRPKYKGVHSAQICLPGGGKEDADDTLETTAIRETQEELGINPTTINVIGSLSSIYIPPSNYVVTPYVAFLQTPPTFIPDPKEVDTIIKTPLQQILEQKNIKMSEVNAGPFKLNVPCFDIFGNIIWGATAMILSEFCEILSGREQI